jgi:NADPH:quinone reductase-like Zn-dependent oxidoreductase
LTTLGADRVFDYTSSPVAEQVRASYPEGVDALIDLVNYTAEDLPLDIVRKGGKVASTMGAIDDETVAAAGLTGVNVMANPSGEVVAGLAGEAAKGALQVHVAAVLPIDLASEGLATIAAGGAHGKIVVTLDE